MVPDSTDIKDAFSGFIKESVSGKHVAIAFSGGLDSGVVAAIAKDYAESVKLYVVGTPGSHDVKVAEESAKELGLPLTILDLNKEIVKDALTESIKLTKTTDPVTLSFEIPLFIVCSNCGEEIILTGQGADELFYGYSKYVGLSIEELKQQSEEDRTKLNDCTLPHESKVANRFGKKTIYPYLDDNVMKSVSKIPLSELMPEDEDNRKTVLKSLCSDLGYPGIAERKKKAAQYGSGAMTLIRSICKEDNCTFPEWIQKREAEE